MVTDKNNVNILLEKFNCKVKNAIYIISCQLCDIKYIGLSTTAINLRLNNHLSHIRKGKSFAVSSHFREHGIENLKIGIIESRKNIKQRDLHILEAYWIDRLGTLNSGLNTRDETKAYLDQHLLNANSHFQHSSTCFPYTISYIPETSQDRI